MTTKTPYIMDSTTPSFTLYCLSFTPNDRSDPGSAFSVSIPLNNGDEFSVCDLKRFIFNQMYHSSRFPCCAIDLRLWKLNVNLPLGDFHSAQSILDEVQIDWERFEGPQGRATKLLPWTKISLGVIDQTMGQHFHLLVQRPSPSYLEIAVPRGQREEISIRTFTKMMRRSPSSDWYHRPETVRRLYAKLQKHRFIVVTGTPGSGKTVLANLLTDYIEDVEPDTSVIFLTSWPRESDWREHSIYARKQVTERGWDRNSLNSVLIIDDAQDTYSDWQLWMEVFKRVAEETFIRFRGRIILFASYGRPDRKFIDDRNATVWLPESRRVSLWPVTFDDELPPVGLSLSPSEYSFVAEKHFRGHHFDSKFLKWVYEISGGHVGTFLDILQYASKQLIYRECEFGKEYTLQSFVKTVSLEDFWTWLGNKTHFARGVPNLAEVRRKEIRNVLEPICMTGLLQQSQVSEGAIKFIEECYSRGWIYNSYLWSEEPCYTFSTPLHQWFVAWHLAKVEPTIPAETTLFQFVRRTFRQFSSSRLFATRRIKPGYVQEKHKPYCYHEEFYRACGIASSLIFPEFGYADGFADFYIPSKGWAIELLWDGTQTEESRDRFSREYYQESVPVKDSVTLDCRTTFPESPRSDAHLYHIVFVNEKVYILDNKLIPVDSFALLA